MAVREADGDSRSYFREGHEGRPQINGGVFADMADWVLEETIAKAAEWQNGPPKGFHPWNSWGGQFTAKQCAEANARWARTELERRRSEKPKNLTPCNTV